jgi:hypothetical protein
VKKVTQSLAVFAAILALTASAFAADCCEKSVAAAKKGKGDRAAVDIKQKF